MRNKVRGKVKWLGLAVVGIVLVVGLTVFIVGNGARPTETQNNASAPGMIPPAIGGLYGSDFGVTVDMSGIIPPAMEGAWGVPAGTTVFNNTE